MFWESEPGTLQTLYYDATACPPLIARRKRRDERAAVRACRTEIARLEREFSLYRADSALRRLNRDGRLEAPSHDMRRGPHRAARRLKRWHPTG